MIMILKCGTLLLVIFGSSTMRNFGCFFDKHTGPAIIEPHTGNTYTYEQLNIMCDTVARSLLSMKSTRRIAIMADNSVRYVVLMFGAMRAGLTVVTIDNKLPKDKKNQLLSDAYCGLVFDDKFINDDWDLWWTEKSTTSWKIPVEVNKDSEAHIQFTSGSTGKPKGVIRTHGSENYLASFQPWSTKGKKYMLASKLHLAGGLQQLITCLGGGGTVVMMNKFTPKSYVDALTKYRVNTVHGVPSVQRLIMSTIKKSNVDVSFVDEIQVASDVVTPKLVDEINEVYNNPKFIHRYATTEGSRPFINGSNKTYDFGFPHPDVEVKLVDGELWHRGDIVFKEYLDQPEETAKVLEDGWYKTNDIMRIDEDGRYWYVGRKDSAFSVNAKIVYPQEVSLVLEKHPSVHQSVCVPVPDDKRTNTVVAFVVKKDDVTAAELLSWFMDNGSEHARPKHYIFLNEMTLNASNKIDMAALKEIAHDTLKSVNVSH